MPIMRGTFIASETGAWSIERVRAVRGDGLAPAPALERLEGDDFFPAAGARWILHGTRSHDRYLERGEKTLLASAQAELGRPQSVLAALIPIKKTEAWWALTQDERRSIFEARSHHIAVGFEYLPAVSRRLYHSRELGSPFDFLTWFEFAPEDADAFDHLLERLRDTEEWAYVEREVEVRLRRRREAAPIPGSGP